MTENKKPIPKPTIRETPSVKPPVTHAGVEEPKAPQVEEEESANAEPETDANDVEVDLVKRFLGALIDGVIAGVIASVIGSITGVSLLSYLTWGLIILTRDSLPFLEGQSLGKKMMKMKAVKEDGSSLSEDWVTGATRNILLAIPLAGLAECYIILKRSGNPGAGLRLGDEWAKTKVIAVE